MKIALFLLVFLIGSALGAFCDGGNAMEGVYEAKALGVKGDGVTDDTAALQKCLDDAAGKGGGIVFLPPAKYLIKGSIKVPPGVSVKGAAQAPLAIEPLVGTIILATGGRDDEKAPALFELGSAASVIGLTVYYPEQKVNDIHPYSWTFHMQGLDNTVENVTLINSYNGIRVGPEPNCRHRIRSVYGCVLRRGIMVDTCSDIGRIDNVQFHCHWWSSASTGGVWDPVYKYMAKNCEAFIFGRTDWEYVNNTFVFPVNIGYHFIKTDSGACNGQFCGIAADASHRSIVVENIQSMGLLITNGQFVAFEGEDPREIVIEKTCSGSVRLSNCAFWGYAVQNVSMHGTGFLSLDNCRLISWRGDDFLTTPLVEADNGKLQVRGCTFEGKKPSVAVRKGALHAIITDNNGVSGVEVINEIGKSAIIRDNEPRK